MKSKSGIWLFYEPPAFRKFRTAQALISQAVHISEHWRSAGHCHHQDNKARRTCRETNTGPSVHDKQKVPIYFLVATDERKWTVNKHWGTKLMRGKSDSQRERERERFYFHDSADMLVSVIVWLQLIVCRGGGGDWALPETPHEIAHEWRFAPLIAGIMTRDYVEAAAGWRWRPQGSAGLFSRHRRCCAPPQAD